MRVLVLNAGSGTITATVHRVGDAARPRQLQSAELVHHRDPPGLSVDGGPEEPLDATGRGDLYRTLLDHVDLDDVDAVGHRVVHGGRLRDHAVLDDDVRQAIDEASLLAPLHNPPALRLVDVAGERLPGVPHVVCLDTVFHTTVPDAAAIYGGPRSWWERGLRRFGFHGISHRDASDRAARIIGRPIEELALLTVHAGGGVSATAVDGGRSVDTTMGLTPAEGPIMASRSGSVDPGLIVHLLRYDRLDADQLESLLMRESGLLGLSGISGSEPDLRFEHAPAPEAQLAVAAYVHSLRSTVGSLLPALGRLDGLVLTGRVLEDDAALRAELVAPFGFAGLRLDPERNERWSAADDAAIVSAGAGPAVVVLPADEEAAIARTTARLVGRP